MISSNHQEDRSALLKEAVKLSFDSASGVEPFNENQIGQVLGELVRTKLLSADDSYRLRDRLLDRKSFNQAIDERIELNLKKRGLFLNV